MNISDAISIIEGNVPNPAKGLGEEVFLFISRMTPMVNVDLLIKNEENQTLLTWRDDGFFPSGWHIPGGIVRYKEKITYRIKAVAACELGATVKFKKEPLAIMEGINAKRKSRGHFISFLYECRLKSSPDERLRYLKGHPRPGEWAWHAKCPYNMVSVHEMYREFI